MEQWTETDDTLVDHGEFEYDAFETDSDHAVWSEELRGRGRQPRRRPPSQRPRARFGRFRRRPPKLGPPAWRPLRPWRRPRPRRLVIRRRPAPCICPAHRTEFVRWVQSSLNLLAGHNLPVTGTMNPRTRNAVRDFQRQHGLTVDGIAGPDTEQALLKARGGHVSPTEQAEAAFDAALLAPPAKVHPRHKRGCKCADCRQQAEGFFGDFTDWLGSLFGHDIDYPVKPGQEYGRVFGSKRPPGLPSATRQAGAPGSALAHVRQVARAKRLGDTFVHTVVQMAKSESGARYGLPARNFNANPPRLRPTGKGLITAWGVFQYNRDAWTCLFSEAERRRRASYRRHGKLGCRGCRGKGGCVFPWDATPKEEVEKPIKQWAGLFVKVRKLGGSSRDAARAVRLFHISPTTTHAWLKEAERSGFASAWPKTVSRQRRRRVDVFLRKAGITDRVDKFGTGPDRDGTHDLESNLVRAVARNRSFSKAIGWNKHYFRIAKELLGINVFPIEESTFAEAVADWQKRNCFPSRGVDGVIGPQTWGEMSHLLGLKAARKPIGPVPEVDTLMPRSGPGFCCRKSAARRYGLPETIAVLKKIGTRWHRSHNDGTHIVISDISKRGGGYFRPHASHRLGIDVDLILRNRKGSNILNTRQKSQYSRRHAVELAKIIRGNGDLKVVKIFFNDAAVSKPQTKSDRNHYRHFHVRFCIPTTYNRRALLKKAFPNGTRGIYASC